MLPVLTLVLAAALAAAPVMMPETAQAQTRQQ